MKALAFLALTLVLLTAVSAATVSLSPNTIYETTTGWHAADVNNYRGSSAITNVKVTSTSIPLASAENYLGWTTVYGNTTTEWKDGSLGTNVRSAWYEFQLTAPTVTQDTIVQLSLTLNNGQPTTQNLTILNDATAPNITGITPYGYVRANNNAQPVAITAIDTETAVASVTYQYNDCSGGANNSVALTQNNNTWTNTVNFGTYNEGMTLCYTVKATNTPGEQATATGQLTFDGTAPSVTAVSPLAYMTEMTTFVFTATDNIATQLNCTVSLDNTPLGSVMANNGTQTQTTQNLSAFTDGSHTWSVSCQDGVGLSNSDSKVAILDTEAPQVQLNANDRMPRNVNNAFNAVITDLGLNTVNATFDGSTVSLSQSGSTFTGTVNSATLGTKTLLVTATDNAGFITQVSKNIEFIPNHALTLQLQPSSTTEGTTVTATGSITADGVLTGTTVTINAPGGSQIVALNGNSYTTTFTAPASGTYNVTATYTEGQNVYTTVATLTVGQTQSSSQQQLPNSGIGAAAWRTSGFVKEEPESTNVEQIEEQPKEEEKPVFYKPLETSQPRQAVTPKATGIFSNGSLNWLLPLLALALLGALGAYAYNKRPKKKDGMSWDGYFDGP